MGEAEVDSQSRKWAFLAFFLVWGRVEWMWFLLSS